VTAEDNIKVRRHAEVILEMIFDCPADFTPGMKQRLFEILTAGLTESQKKNFAKRNPDSRSNDR
jgi:hypothetical protein